MGANRDAREGSKHGPSEQRGQLANHLGTPYRETPEGKVFGPYADCDTSCPPYCDGHRDREVLSPALAGHESETEEPQDAPPKSTTVTVDAERKKALLADELDPFRHIKRSAMDWKSGAPEIAVIGGSSGPSLNVLEIGRRRKSRNLRFVCVCGHSEGAHIRDSTFSSCHIGMTWCGCQYPAWVLLAKNVRHFAHKTGGAGPNHALTKGIVSSQKAGVELESLIEKTCWSCLSPTSNLIPVSLMIGRGEVRPTLDFDGQANALWCTQCCEKNSVAIWFPGQAI